MRDITNAMLRFSWMLPLFGMKQMLDTMTCQSCGGKGTTSMVDALNQVSDAARQHLSGTMEQAARACERAQKTMSDAVFNRRNAEGFGSASGASSGPGSTRDYSGGAEQG